VKPLPRADFAGHLARLSLLGALPAIALGAVFVAGGGSRAEWTALALAIAMACFCAHKIRRLVSHVLHTIANLISAVHDGDFSVRGKSQAGHDDVAFAFSAINALGDVLREQRLSALEATTLLRKVIQAIDTAIFAFDDADRLCLINPAGERLLGKHAQRSVGRTAEQLGVSAWLSGETPRKIMVDKPGGKGAWELRYGVFRQAGRRHTLVVAGDVSRLVRGEERQAWKDIIRVLSHEINNSLAPIASISQGLRSHLERPGAPPVEDIRDGLDVISRRSESLQRFMANYGRLSRLPPPEYGTFAIEPWLRRIAALEERVPVALEGPMDATVEADEGLLEQALINLVRNAADASVGTGKAVRITWSTGERPGCDPTAEGQDVKIEIMDSGPGIAEGAVLFVPFFTTKPTGAGIGLVLSREIVESHDGQLTLSNRKDAPGCVASIVLPRVRSLVRDQLETHVEVEIGNDLRRGER
jgi:nitrogen fixation/metabolism regulation signal transduction histidine kinase